MSEKFFYDKFFQSLIELHEQIQLEQWPATVGPNGKRPADSWTHLTQYENFYIGVYIKYIYLLRKIEDCYDQIIHVQIRDMVRKFLENIICRLVKVKFELCYYSIPDLQDPKIKPLDYIFLDDYLIDLKLEPCDLEIPIPRFFREDFSKERRERNCMLEERLKEVYKNGKRLPDGNTLPEQDKIKNFYVADMSLEDAISVIQNFEISRQNIKRIEKLTKVTKKVEENKGGENMVSEEKKKATYRHLLAVYKVQKLREEELKFLKMKKNYDPTAAIIPALNAVGTNSTENDERFKDIESPSKVREIRKVAQREKEEEFQKYQQELEDQIKLIEGPDLKQKMINERRDWIDKYRHDNKGEPPQQLVLYYDSFKVTLKQELDDNQKKEKDKIAKDKLKKEQDKKKKGEQGDKIAIKMYTGPNGIEMQNIQKYIEDFKLLFETPSEFINQKDDFIKNLAYKTAMDKITEAVRLEVDDAISAEIFNLRFKYLKGKKDKIKKPPKVKVPPEKFCTGEKPLAKEQVADLFYELVQKKVIRKMVPTFLEDLICDFNYVAQTMHYTDSSLIDIPLFYTKQLIKEYLIFPLGSAFVKKNMGFNVPSVLFHGPPGTGKTHAAMAIAYHTDSLFIDLSPRNLEGKMNSKEEITRLLASAFRVAKYNQPAIIYFDNAEQIFPKAKMKGAVKNPTAQKMKKYLNSMKNLINPEMRVLIIGCSSRPHYIAPKDLKSFFSKTLFFGLPTYSDRLKIWKTKVKEKIQWSTKIRMADEEKLKSTMSEEEAAIEFNPDCGALDNSLDYAILAEMSNGYSQESIIDCINYTLSRQRLDRIRLEPLDAKEFITTLSRTQYLYAEDYEEQRKFLSIASGMEEIKNFLREKAAENEKNNKK